MPGLGKIEEPGEFERFQNILLGFAKGLFLALLQGNGFGNYWFLFAISWVFNWGGCQGLKVPSHKVPCLDPCGEKLENPSTSARGTAASTNMFVARKSNNKTTKTHMYTCFC